MIYGVKTSRLGTTHTTRLDPGTTHDDAYRATIKVARAWDHDFGGSGAFWTVDLVNMETGGSFAQFFHGRTS